MTETPLQDRVDTDHLRDFSQLRRSRTDRKVAGVAGGLGRHLNIDPTILRVAFVVLVFFGGAGFLLYGALWLFVPEDGSDEAVISTSDSARNGLLVAAAVLAGLLLVGDSWGFGFPWPLILIGLVVLILLMNRDKPVSTTYPPPPPPGRPDGEETGATEDTTAYTASPYDAPTAPYYGSVPPTATPYPVEQAPRPRRDRGPKLFWFTLALLAVALGSLGLYESAGGDVVDAAYPALALAVVGTMLVVGAWFGRAGGLILLGLVAAVALIGTSVAEPRFDGDRRLTETPTTARQVADRYHVPAGQILVDMSNIRDVERLDGRTVEVDANAGEIVVILPENIDVAIDADVAVAGEIDLLGQQRGGTGVSLDRDVDGGADAPSMELELDLVVGSIEVRQ